MRRLLLIIAWFILEVNTSFTQHTGEQHWLDSMLTVMSPQQKIGQMFIIRSFSNDQENHVQSVVNTIQKFQVGGVCYFKGTSNHLQKRIQQYRQASTIPLINSMDAEWGGGMRLTDIRKYPKQFCLGSLTDNRKIYYLAKAMGQQLRQLGIHMNFAPVVDINNNLQNPVINERSFGSDRVLVTKKSFAFLQGLQDGGVLACLKHFPGHGDTDVDSHSDLPELSFSRKRLDSMELFPYQALLPHHPAAVMVGHLHIPVLDTQPNLPATLSNSITHYLLRDSFNYRGLIITDALEMSGVTKNFSDGDIAVKAIQAGNDMLLLSQNLEQATQAIQEAIFKGELSWERVHQSVSKILLVKYRLGLFDPPVDSLVQVDVQRMNRDIDAINEPIYRASFCLGRDPQQLVPIRNLPKKLVTLQLGNGNSEPFRRSMSRYTNIRSFALLDTSQWNDSLEQTIMQSDLVVLHLHGLNYKANKLYGIDPLVLQLINPILRHKKCLAVLFGSPYVSMYLPDHCSIFLAHEENEMTQDLAGQMLMGTDPIQGVSPVTVSQVLLAGKGIIRPSLHRMGYSIPEVQGMSSDTLMAIERIAQDIIQQQAAPGCQIVVARNNKIVYQKSFGYLSYDSLQPVTNNCLYDVASLTKVLATAPILFQLENRNQLDLSRKFADYLPMFKETNKSNLSFRDFMLHQGKLLSWIPYYKSTLWSSDSIYRYHPVYYDTLPSSQFNIPVAHQMYLRKDFQDSILTQILDSRLLEEKKVNYSDLGFYFLPKLVHQITGRSFERYFMKEIAEPLELSQTLFNPMAKGIPPDSIAPTEIDTYWRKQVLRGYVHDMGAAMMGGVSAHAGLFSNATEVARIMQLYLNCGQYRGYELLQTSSMRSYLVRDREFLRRSYLFDMQSLQDTIRPYVSRWASTKTIGHQGFTGTCAWIDPEQQINYVFLSNRTFPNAENNLLHKERFRTKIHDIIYQSLIKDSEGKNGLVEPNNVINP